MPARRHDEALTVRVFRSNPPTEKQPATVEVSWREGSRLYTVATTENGFLEPREAAQLLADAIGGSVDSQRVRVYRWMESGRLKPVRTRYGVLIPVRQILREVETLVQENPPRRRPRTAGAGGKKRGELWFAG
jgi:hypothetical protein